MKELYKLAPDTPGAVDLGKAFSRRYCNHKEPVNSDACIEAMIGPYPISASPLSKGDADWMTEQERKTKLVMS